MSVDTATKRGPGTGVPLLASSVSPRALELRAEIEAVLGFFPPFFKPALVDPDLLEGMWHHMARVYMSPVPVGSKTKLFAQLANCCDVPYMTAVHSCLMLEQGSTSAEVAELLRSPPGPEADASLRHALWAVRPALDEWPEERSALEAALHHAAFRLFMGNEASEWRAAVRHALSERMYSHLVGFLTFVESSFRWVEAHPEVMSETAPWVAARLRGLFADQPHLRAFLAPDTLAEARPRRSPIRSDPQADDRFLKVFAEAPIGIAVVAPDFRILEANAAMCAIVGYREFELVGMTFVEITHPDDVGIDVDLAQQLFAGNIPSYRMEKRYIKKSGETVWVQLTASTLDDRNGAPLYGLGMIENIDGRKRAEALEIEHTKELERSNAALQEFTHMISHDLKEPLRTIAGFSKLLAQHQAASRDGHDDVASDLVASILTSCDHMSGLIDGLLEYARVGEERDLRPVDLNRIVAEASRGLRRVIGETGAQIVVDDLPIVAGHAVLLTQLFQNLLGNALKFRGEQAPCVRVSASRHADEWQIAVSDNGIGIPSADAPRVFAMFERLCGPDEYPGSGVGLAVCRKIIELHDGRIWVEPTDEAGTTIAFALPAAS